MQRKGKKEDAGVQRGEGLYFDTGPNINGLPLLLPDESCIAEDEHVLFRFRCAREGFHLFGWGDVILYNVQAKVYLTNYRVSLLFLESLNSSLFLSPYHLRSKNSTPFPYVLKLLRIHVLEQQRILNLVIFLNSISILITEIYGAPEIPRAKRLENYLIQGVPTPVLIMYIELAWCVLASFKIIVINGQIACQFRRLPRATMFLKGIKALTIDGRVCPTRQCRFIEYEDLPVYCSVAAEPPACTSPLRGSDPSS
jgi:hypothetical protein